MIAYNHENYIKEAIEGVLKQNTDFDIEFVISNDKSSDETHQIISTIIKSYAGDIVIKYYNQSTNLGMLPNFIFSLQKCNGQYIALCEGDDYWTDPLKLKKQVSFLEKNLDYGICFHPIQVYNQSKKIFIKDSITREVRETTTINELSKGNYIHTPSILLRNNFSLPKWFASSPIGDWALYMIIIKDKKVKKINNTMAVYRENEEGVWTGKNRMEKMIMTMKTFKLVYNNIEMDQISKSNLKREIDLLNKVIKGENSSLMIKLKKVLNFFYIK